MAEHPLRNRAIEVPADEWAPEHHELAESAMRQGLPQPTRASWHELTTYVDDVDGARRWRILEPAEVAAVDRAFAELAEQADGPERARLAGYRVAFLTLIVTGLRRHELEGLRWRHVDLIDSVLGVEKSKSEAGERGTRLCASTYADAFRDALSRAGVDGYVRPFHDARHASLTLGAATGEGSVALMTRAGHANMATTKQYLPPRRHRLP